MPKQLVDVSIPNAESKKMKFQALSSHLNDKLRKSITSRQTQVDLKMSQWQSNYDGMPKVSKRTTPFVGASNFVPGLIRMHVDIMHARISGYLWGVKPFWKPTFFSPNIKHEWLDQLSQWMDHKWNYEMEAFDTIDTILHDTAKLGLCVAKGTWVERAKYTQENPGQTISKTFRKMEFYPIAFQDFIPYPITARTLKQVQIKFHRLRYTEEEVRFKISTGEWDKEAGELILRSSVTPNGAAAEKSANFSGIQLTADVSRPYQVVEAWLDYELVPGQMHSLVVLFNPQFNSHQSIIRCYYHPIGLDQSAFIDFRLFVKPNLFYPDSIPMILEDSHEEKAQIHNTRRDASTIANIPTWAKKRYSDVANPKDEWYPGKVWELDDVNNDLKMMSNASSYNHMMEEEKYCDELADRLVGNPPPTQGFGSGSMGKRGIYNTQGTLAMMGMGNDRMDLILKRLRNPFHRVGLLTYESYRDFGGEGQFQESDSDLQQAFSLKPPDGYTGTFFGLGCSDAGTNRETERTSLMLMGNTMASYYSQIMGLLPQVVQADGPVKELMLEVLDGARDLASRLLTAFNIQDKKRLVPDLRAVLAGGSPNDGPAAPNRAGMSGPEAPVQQSDLQNLSATVASIAGASRTGAMSNGSGNGIPPI